MGSIQCTSRDVHMNCHSNEQHLYELIAAVSLMGVLILASQVWCYSFPDAIQYKLAHFRLVKCNVCCESQLAIINALHCNATYNYTHKRF